MRGSDTNESRKHVIKRNKRYKPFLIVLLFVIGTTVTPAAATPKDDEPSITIINEQLDLIEEDPVINSFLYARMNEYNEFEGLEAVKVVVIAGHQLTRPREMKTFYIVRNDTADQIDIRDSYEYNEGTVWTFYPRTGQAVYALKVLLSRQATVKNLVHLAVISVVIEKENVPDLAEIIDDSPWLSSYLTDKDKDLLAKFEFVESHLSLGMMRQLMQKVERKTYNLLIPL